MAYSHSSKCQQNIDIIIQYLFVKMSALVGAPQVIIMSKITFSRNSKFLKPSEFTLITKEYFDSYKTFSYIGLDEL